MMAARAETIGAETIGTDARLRLHLQTWLGRWPAVTVVHGIDVIGSRRRHEPGWDGRISPLIGVGTPDAFVLSVPPEWAARVSAYLRSLPDSPTTAIRDDMRAALPTLLDLPQQKVYSGIFRYSDRPADLPDAGVWIRVDSPEGDRVPPWLRPFGHEVLIAWDPDTGDYLAGVGLKHHDRYGRELAVGTEPTARGRGLARRLVAQAARRILDEGAIPTYQHDPDNVASARVADAAGFPDRGWRSLGLG